MLNPFPNPKQGAMTQEAFNKLLIQVEEAGYGGEIGWARDIQPCDDHLEFMYETCWVIINSGMKEQIARKIWERIKYAWSINLDISEAFGHEGKVAAIKMVYEKSQDLFAGYLNAEDKISFLLTIPYIGKITVWHLAKNLGLDCAKPDRHLERIAAMYETTPKDLCERLSKLTGERVATVDTVIWRACNLGIL